MFWQLFTHYVKKKKPSQDCISSRSVAMISIHWCITVRPAIRQRSIFIYAFDRVSTNMLVMIIHKNERNDAIIPSNFKNIFFHIVDITNIRHYSGNVFYRVIQYVIHKQNIYVTVCSWLPKLELNSRRSNSIRQVMVVAKKKKKKD